MLHNKKIIITILSLVVLSTAAIANDQKSASLVSVINILLSKNSTINAGFTHDLIDNRQFFSIIENSLGGETCIIEMNYTNSSVDSQEWVYHSDDNWTSGCQEDFGPGTYNYTINNGVINLDTGDGNWPTNLVEIFDDHYMVGNPDDPSHPWYFTKEKVNLLLNP